MTAGGSVEGHLEVFGGAGGIEAQYLDMEQLARHLQKLGDDVSQYAWEDKFKAVDGDIAAAALLCPLDAAGAESSILVATGGLVLRSLALELSALSIEANVKISRLADAFSERLVNGISYSIGYYATVNPGQGGTALLGLGALSAMTGDESLMGGAYQGLADGIERNGAARAGLFVLAHLPLGETVNGVAGDLYDGIHGGRRAGAIEKLEVTEQNSQPIPTSVQDLVHGINTANTTSGAFTVQEVVGADGTTRWIVQLPGTDFNDWDSSRDFTGNLQLLDGSRTAYGDSISQALADAGADADDPVLLTGHSQGGMQAMALADDPDFDYQVKGVVTFGSPVAQVDPPDDIAVLNVENSDDPVPMTDGGHNGRGPHQVTVSGTVETGSLLGNHDLDASYLPLSGMVDSSSDASVRGVLAEMNAAGFLTEDASAHSTTHAYQSVVVE